MIYKMPGDEWQKFANLRLLYTYMFTHPGAKLLFMGNEFAQTSEWNYKTELDWPLLQFDCHKLMQACVRDLNMLYRDETALHKLQFDPKGFEWVDLNHRQESVVAHMRKARNRKDDVLVVLNLTPVPRHDWKIRVKERRMEGAVQQRQQKTGEQGNVYNPHPKARLVDKKRASMK